MIYVTVVQVHSYCRVIKKYVNEGKILRQESFDIARLLADKSIPGSVIFGAHKNRMNNDNWNNAELRHILANWYREEMHCLDREEALLRLAVIFEDTTLNIRCLASEIRRLATKNKVDGRHENSRFVHLFQ